MAHINLDEIHSKMELLARKICEASGVNLIELKIKGHINDSHIQIIADRPSGGITVGECVTIHKALADAVMKENILTPGTYSMEVSSPGLA